jgi:phage terminase large subunit
MTNNPEYVENLENLPEMRKRAMLYGDWDAFEGQYFSEFNRDIHVIEPFEIPEGWNRYVSIDYGLDMFAVVFIAIDTQNRSYVYNEIYQSNLIVSEAAQLLKKYIDKQEIKLIYGPPDLENRRNDTGKSAMDIFREHGIRLHKSDNRRIDGWYAVKEWIKTVDKKDEQTGEIKKISSLRIFKNCVNLIRTLPQLQYDDHNPNDVSNEPHELTHIPDALRGFCIMRTSPTKTIEDPKYIAGRLVVPKRSEWSTEIPIGFFNK